MTVHKDGAHEFRLPLEQESDGSIRYLNLLPILYWAGKSQHSGVYLIDELEDSLHPKLTEELLRLFLDSSGAGREASADLYDARAPPPACRPAAAR